MLYLKLYFKYDKKKVSSHTNFFHIIKYVFYKFAKAFFNFGYKWVSLKGTTKSISRTPRQASIFRADTILTNKRGTTSPMVSPPST